ncbi:MAG: hypothetical protein LBS43_06040 [Prevotellaceae bacterium]|jgi:hypothetical protein|nr:hypothetical protein [Prevotellaceae bacterium]
MKMSFTFSLLSIVVRRLIFRNFGLQTKWKLSDFGAEKGSFSLAVWFR